MNKKKIIATLVIILIMIIGISGFVVNAQYQKKQEAIRIAESEAEESRALEEAQEAKLLELQEIEDRVYALYLDETHDFLVDEITQEMIDEVNILIEAQDGKEVYDYADMLNSSISELSTIQTMYTVQSEVSALTLEYAITDDGKAKLDELQVSVTELKETKSAFADMQQAIIDGLNVQLTSIADLEARIKTYFTDETLATPVDTVTREELNDLIAQKDTITVESKRLELEATLMTIVNYLDAKDAEAARIAEEERLAAETAQSQSSSSNSSSSSNNSSSSSSNSGYSSNNSGSTSSNNSSSSSAPATTDNSSSSAPATTDNSNPNANSGTKSYVDENPIYYDTTNDYTGEVDGWGITGGGIVPGGFY